MTWETHGVYPVAIMAHRADGEPIGKYFFDWNNPDHRRIALEQTNNAIRAGQVIVLCNQEIHDEAQRVHGSDLPIQEEETEATNLSACG